MANTSSHSHTSYAGGSLQHPRIEEREGPCVDELESELMFDLEVDIKANNAAGLGPSAPRRSCYKSRFITCQAGVEAYTKEVNEGIDDTHHQRDLLRRPSI